MESLKTSDSLNQTTTQNSEPVKNNFNEHNANSNDIFKNKKAFLLVKLTFESLSR